MSVIVPFIILFAVAYVVVWVLRKLIGERIWGKLMHFRRSTK